MKLTTAILGALALMSGINALPADLDATVEGRNVVALEAREPIDTSPLEGFQELFKRKGGGGGGGRGTTSGSSSSGSSSSGSSSSGGRTGGTSSGSSTSGTRTGSGVSPAYGGGRYYSGGATTAYRTGGRSTGGISPLALGAGLGLGFGLYGLWLYNVYSYPYSQPWKFHNTTTNTNETKPVICLCEEYSECGCDDNTNSTYQAELLGNGSYDALNKSVISVANINGTDTIVLNGTLPNGTLETTATDTSDSSAMHTVAKGAGYWALTALVGAAVFLV